MWVNETGRECSVEGKGRHVGQMLTLTGVPVLMPQACGNSRVHCTAGEAELQRACLPNDRHAVLMTGMGHT